ncbi:hypothetical protein FISHEDRAFT_77045 [Fistulina hepatica ATCC 64428]|uniref:RING-type E3 ubiquitin transferase n=1 Tax=Fistulina hepatica ATCC 64428 TaxID=1128425 RepID=A0A0D7A2J0_9AGAR|nr:hypothetical protein FISHEDRAFT_77045 [Fistulina hepatica ATCC 64428]
MDADEDTNTRSSQRPRASIPSFLFLSVILFLLTNHNGEEFLARHHYQLALANLGYQLGNYTAWMEQNATATNFTVSDRSTALDDPLKSLGFERGTLDPSHAAYFSNITGYMHGGVEVYNLTSSAHPQDAPERKDITDIFMKDVNLTQVHSAASAWNWSATSKMTLRLVERAPQEVNVSDKLCIIHGRIEVEDGTSDHDMKFDFMGVHFINNGSIYGLAGDAIDIRRFPSLVPVLAKNETAALIVPELTSRIEKLNKLIDAGVIDQDFDVDKQQTTLCAFDVFIQLEPVPVPEDVMHEYEVELLNPTGVITIKRPLLSSRALMVSRTCGVMVNMKSGDGLRYPSFFRKVTTYAGAATALYLALVILFTRQAAHSRTPSGISRLSRWSFIAQFSIDVLSFVGHTTFAILGQGRPALAMIACAFLAMVLFVHEAQLAMLIYQVQIPENETPARPLPATTTTSAPATTTNAPASQPAVNPTATTMTTVPPEPTDSFWSFFMHHLRHDPQARVWIIMFFFFTFMLRIILSPTFSIFFICVGYSLFWLPEIVRAVRCGRSSSVTAEYVIGTTVCRLCFVLYFMGCPKNILDISPHPSVYVLFGFVWLQVCVLLLQDCLGPTFFLPKRFAAVKGYDYHPVLPLPDDEAPEQTLGDCSICMEAIEIDVPQRVPLFDKEGKLRAPSALGTALTVAQARKNYSLAPCHHLFHTECLERWLAIKNICPQCRRPLPPM